MKPPFLQLHYALNGRRTFNPVIGRIRPRDEVKLIIQDPGQARFIHSSPSKVHSAGGITTSTKLGSELNSAGDNIFCWVVEKLGKGKLRLHAVNLICHENVWRFQEIVQTVQFNDSGLTAEPIYYSGSDPHLTELLKEIVAPDFYAHPIPS